MALALDLYADSIRSAIYAAFGATSLHPQTDVAWPNDEHSLVQRAGASYATVTIHWEHKREPDIGAGSAGELLGSIVVQLYAPVGASLKVQEQDLSALAAYLDWLVSGDVQIHDAIPQTVGRVDNYFVSRVLAEFEVLFL